MEVKTGKSVGATISKVFKLAPSLQLSDLNGRAKSFQLHAHTGVKSNEKFGRKKVSSEHTEERLDLPGRA